MNNKNNKQNKAKRFRSCSDINKYNGFLLELDKLNQTKTLNNNIINDNDKPDNDKPENDKPENNKDSPGKINIESTIKLINEDYTNKYKNDKFSGINPLDILIAAIESTLDPNQYINHNFESFPKNITSEKVYKKHININVEIENISDLLNIINEYPDVLVSKETSEQKIAKVAAIKGMARKTAEAFVERIPQFLEFLKEANLEEKLNSKNIENKLLVDQSHPLYNKTIIMSGFRDQDLQDKLKSVGAKLGSSVSKNTFVVLVKDVTEDTGKVLDAKKIGVPIMTIEEFKEKYL